MSDDTIEVRRGVVFEEGREYYQRITNKRTPKRDRVVVPRELWERYERILKEYEAASNEMDGLFTAQHFQSDS